MLLALVFGAVFLAALSGLTLFVLSENRLQSRGTASAEALSLAEAGLEYYRWYLAHYPDDAQSSYQFDYQDPEGGAAGTVTLEINGNRSCGALTSVDIRSTGEPAGTQDVSKTLSARYARPSVGTFSYILNDSVWAGADRIILGPYHSNGGIRMDGSANAPVTSSVESWLCDGSAGGYGCTGASGNPSPGMKPGVFGAASNQELWSYPTPQVSFEQMEADFGALRTTSQEYGIYYPRYSSGTNTGNVAYWRGYHVVFNANNTVTIRRVQTPQSLSLAGRINSEDAASDWARFTSGGYASSFTTAGRENNPGETCSSGVCTVPIPEDCGLLFFEDHIWVEGTIPSKVTLVAAIPGEPVGTRNAYLRNNITYVSQDGSSGLTLIAARNVLISPDSPQDMMLNGIFIARGGAFGRNYYGAATQYEPRGTLTILGTTVSNKRTGTRWCGATDCPGGYQVRIDSYDRRIATDPPPFTPVVSNDYQFVDWREE